MWKSVGVTHYQILPNNNIGATGTAYHLTLLKLFVYGHGQPLNSSTSSNNKMFSICASATLWKLGPWTSLGAWDPYSGPQNPIWGPGPLFRAQNSHSERRTPTQGPWLSFGSQVPNSRLETCSGGNDSICWLLGGCCLTIKSYQTKTLGHQVPLTI